MKSIELYTTAVDNAKRRVEAGVTVAVGDKPDQISLDRAKELVSRKAAVTVKATAAPKKPTVAQKSAAVPPPPPAPAAAPLLAPSAADVKA